MLGQMGFKVVPTMVMEEDNKTTDWLESERVGIFPSLADRMLTPIIRQGSRSSHPKYLSLSYVFNTPNRIDEIMRCKKAGIKRKHTRDKRDSTRILEEHSIRKNIYLHKIS